MTTSDHDTPPKSSKPANTNSSSSSSVLLSNAESSAHQPPKEREKESGYNSASGIPATATSPQSSRDPSPTRSRVRPSTAGSVNINHKKLDKFDDNKLDSSTAEEGERERSTEQQSSPQKQAGQPSRSPATALRLSLSKSRASKIDDASPTRSPSNASAHLKSVNTNAASYNTNASLPSPSFSTSLHKKLVPSARSSTSSSGNSTPLRSQSPKNRPLPTNSLHSNSVNTTATKSLRAKDLLSPKGAKGDSGYFNTPPSIIVEDSSPVMSDSAPNEAGSKASGGNADGTDGSLPQPAKVRSSTTLPPKLETVEEGSQPATPGNEISNMLSSSSIKTNQTDKDSRHTSNTDSSGYFSDNPGRAENNGESSGKQSKKESENESSTRTRLLSTKSSLSRLAPVKSRARTDPSTQNMTVETETVSSIAQAPISTAQNSDRNASGRSEHNNGSIKLRPSNETIRPKRDRKWTTRKPTTIAAGNASSKADVFEAKVASAVDEANSSDSEETFVYESNPPEPPSRLGRHHSRTPSTNSMHSIAEQRGLRSIGSVLDSTRGILGKKSMKFSTNSYNNPSDDGGIERVESGRHSRNGTAGGGVVHHHHIGRYGRPAPGSNNPYFLSESDSPFTQANKGRNSRHSSRPSSPGHAKSRYGPPSGRKNEHSNYTMDLEAADDERTPLVGTTRTRSARAQRRPNNIDLHHLHYFPLQERNILGRCAGCFSITFLVLVIILSALAFLLATTKPLYSVHVHEIQNVLASEQELMLDLLVKAVNPNLVSITIADMDVNVFAKSKYVGSEKWWRDHGGPFPPSDDDDDEALEGDRRHQHKQKGKEHHHRSVSYVSPNNSTHQSATATYPANTPTSLSPTSLSTSTATPPSSASKLSILDNVHRGTDPVADPEGDAQTMLLGRIFHFDSALTFEGSAFKRDMRYGTGEVRLRHPGNKTEAGGTERWERVLQHRFDLIVRGVLKYQLPLSSRLLSSPVNGVVVVEPDVSGSDGEDGGGDGIDGDENLDGIDWSGLVDDSDDATLE